MRIEVITFHWHGMLQRGTPWMNGADMISQCAILPGQTFEYRWVKYKKTISTMSIQEYLYEDYVIVDHNA